MSQASATKLISKLRYNIRDRRKLRNVDGPAGRHNKIKKTLTALLKHERIELNFHRADESRGYAERLISDAIRYGDCHKPTMEMASYWIIEPQIVHKLFKVLAPRYKNSDKSYTKMWRAPHIYPGYGYSKCVLELRDNIYPPLEPDKSSQKNLIHNVLLEEARKAYVKKKMEEAASTASAEEQKDSRKEASQSQKINKEVQTKLPVDGDVDSDKVKMTNGESELSSEKTLKAEGESEIKNEVDSSPDVDLSKLKITDHQPKETLHEDKKE